MITRSPKEFKEVFEKIQRSGHFNPTTMRAGLLIDPLGFNTSLQSAQDNVYVAVDSVIDMERAHAQHSRRAKRRTRAPQGAPRMPPSTASERKQRCRRGRSRCDLAVSRSAGKQSWTRALSARRRRCYGARRRRPSCQVRQVAPRASMCDRWGAGGGLLPGRLSGLSLTSL